MDIREELFKMQDTAYKDFHSKLMPTVPEETVIGVRVPRLREFAKVLAKENQYNEFLNSLPHQYYEENNVHAFIVESIKDFDEALLQTEKFLPYIDNWATCDMFRPKIFRKNKEKLLPKIYEWLKSGKTYTVRYAIGLLLSFYSDDENVKEYFEKIYKTESDEYYVNMMIAWYFATMLSKQYDKVIEVLKKHKLSTWVHNKTIQKAIESKRIDKDKKDFLKTLKIKD